MEAMDMACYLVLPYKQQFPVDVSLLAYSMALSYQQLVPRMEIS